MSIENLKSLVQIFEGATGKLALKTDAVGEIAWLLASAILEKSRTAVILLDSGWHGGLIEIIRSQMEVSADFMLFVKDPKHYEVLRARQNATVVSVINRAKAAKKSLPGVSRALKDKVTGKTLDAAHALALKNRNQAAEKPFIEIIAQAKLSEDNYRYLCSFAHHNLTALRIRFRPTNGGAGEIGRVSDELLALLVGQAVKNLAGPLMVLAELTSANRLQTLNSTPNQ